MKTQGAGSGVSPSSDQGAGSPGGGLVRSRQSGFLARLAQVARERSLRPNTIKTYSHWIRLFYRWSGKKPASQWRGRDVSDFIKWLDSKRYADTSRDQALCALIFAFKRVLNIDVGTLELPPHPRQRQTIKIIPTPDEIGRLMLGLHGQSRLMALLIYGAGTRVMETCQLRVKDVDFERGSLRVHGGKGDKSRLTVLPQVLIEPLRRHIARRAVLHERDLARGHGLVDMPNRLAIKLPSAARSLAWQFLFPSSVVHEDGKRWHVTPTAIQKAMRQAGHDAGFMLAITPHTLRHAFATHSLQAGANPLTIRDQMGHECLETTQIYLHADQAPGFSPLDRTVQVISSRVRGADCSQSPERTSSPSSPQPSSPRRLTA